MSSIVFYFLFFIKVSVPAPFRHRYRFKSIGYVPVSDKNQTIPIPSHEVMPKVKIFRQMHSLCQQGAAAWIGWYFH